MKNKLIWVLLFSAAFCARAQTPRYDSTLAAKLKADKHGMRSFVMAVLKTGPATLIKGAELDSLFAGHMRNIQALADEGLLAVAGPFGKNGDGMRGIFILTVTDIEDAKKLCARDPSIQAGVFTVDYYKWYGSAAMVEINDIHKRITRP